MLLKNRNKLVGMSVIANIQYQCAIRDKKNKIKYINYQGSWVALRIAFQKLLSSSNLGKERVKKRKSVLP